MITKSLRIGNIIHEKCRDLFDGRCYPVIADKGADYPFMLYRRSGIYLTESKDRFIVDNVNVEIIVADSDYDRSVELIQAVKDRLELHRFRTDEVYIMQTEVTGCSENWHNDAYIQTLALMFKVCSAK